MRVIILFSLLILAGPANAASFDCKKAATPVERTICGDPALSSLDERAVAAYVDAVDTLGISDDLNDPAGELLLRGHQEWAAARNRCGTVTSCMLQQYLRRLAVLNFKPDSQAPSPLDPAIGRYGTPIDPPREMLIMAAPGNAALVSIRVTTADWKCVVTGSGRIETGGAIRVTRADFNGRTNGAHAVLLTPTRLGYTLRHADAKDNASAQFCGAGGSLEHPFPRRN